MSHILNIVLNNHLVPIPHPSQNNVYLFSVVVVGVLFENMFLPYMYIQQSYLLIFFNFYSLKI